MIDKDFLPILDFQPIKKNKTSGSSFDTQRLQYGFLSSLTIDGVSFQDVGIGIQDLSFIPSPFSDKRKIAGIIGTNILRKASWQINYQDRTITFSNTLDNLELGADPFVIDMKPRNKSGWGYNRIELSLDGNLEQFIFDTGSSGSLTGNPELLERLGSNDMNEKVIEIDTLRCGRITMTEVPLHIEKGVGLLIGNAFFDKYLVTIDWNSNKLFLSR